MNDQLASRIWRFTSRVIFLVSAGFRPLGSFSAEAAEIPPTVAINEHVVRISKAVGLHFWLAGRRKATGGHYREGKTRR